MPSRTNKNPEVNDHIRAMAKDPSIMVDLVTDLIARYDTDFYSLKVARRLFTANNLKPKTGADLKKKLREYKLMRQTLMTLRRSALKYPKLFKKLLIDRLPVRAVAPGYGIAFQRLSVLRQYAQRYSEYSGMSVEALVKFVDSKNFAVPKFCLT